MTMEIWNNTSAAYYAIKLTMLHLRAISTQQLTKTNSVKFKTSLIKKLDMYTTNDSTHELLKLGSIEAQLKI